MEETVIIKLQRYQDLVDGFKTVDAQLKTERELNEKLARHLGNLKRHLVLQEIFQSLIDNSTKLEFAKESSLRYGAMIRLGDLGITRDEVINEMMNIWDERRMFE